jgi:hypothetical protein
MTFWRPLVVNPHRRGGFFSPPKRPVPTGRAKLPAANRPTVVRVVMGVFQEFRAGHAVNN